MSSTRPKKVGPIFGVHAQLGDSSLQIVTDKYLSQATTAARRAKDDMPEAIITVTYWRDGQHNNLVEVRE